MASAIKKNKKEGKFSRVQRGDVREEKEKTKKKKLLSSILL